MISVTRSFEWDAAHRLLGHEGQCRSLHGHRYRAEITFSVDELDKLGRVIDFGVIKRIVKSWVDTNWDHTTIVSDDDTELFDFVFVQHEKAGGNQPYVVEGPPTAELMARVLFERTCQLMAPFRVGVVRVKLFETPNCWATYEP